MQMFSCISIFWLSWWILGTARSRTFSASFCSISSSRFWVISNFLALFWRALCRGTLLPLFFSSSHVRSRFSPFWSQLPIKKLSSFCSISSFFMTLLHSCRFWVTSNFLASFWRVLCGVGGTLLLLLFSSSHLMSRFSPFWSWLQVKGLYSFCSISSFFMFLLHSCRFWVTTSLHHSGGTLWGGGCLLASVVQFIPSDE